MERVPKVGEILDFYDDGKISNSRHCKCIVCKVVPFEEANLENILFAEYYNDLTDNEPPYTLHDIWEMNKKDSDIHEKETDYFIGVAMPEYDEHIIWFARSTDGGWFSIDIQNFWQGGRLDVDGKLTKLLQ